MLSINAIDQSRGLQNYIFPNMHRITEWLCLEWILKSSYSKPIPVMNRGDFYQTM